MVKDTAENVIEPGTENIREENKRLRNENLALSKIAESSNKLVARYEAALKATIDCRTNEDAWAAIEIARNALNAVEKGK